LEEIIELKHNGNMEEHFGMELTVSKAPPTMLKT
jgi:hypothetical protein